MVAILLSFQKPDYGSQFILYFPRYIHHGIEKVKDSQYDTEHLSGNETILVVDDESALNLLAKSILSSHGYRLFSAESGKHALEILQL